MLTEGSDDQQRLLLALTLSLGLFLAVNHFFGPTPDQNNQAQKNGKTEKETPSTGGSKGEPKSDETETSSPEDQPSDSPDDPDSTSPDSNDNNNGATETNGSTGETGQQPDTKESQKERKIVLENDELKATFSSRGATLSSLILKKYYQTAEHEQKVHLFDDRFQNDTISFSIRKNTEDQEELDVNQENWTVVEKEIDQSAPTIVFRNKLASGLVVEKTFTLPSDRTHMMNYDVRFASPDKSRETSQLKLYSPGGIVLQSKQDQSYHLGLFGYESEGEWTYENDIKPSTFDNGNTVEERDVGTNPVWTGLTTKYFASVFIPQDRSDLLAYNFEGLRTEEAGKTSSSSRKDLQEVLHPDKSMIGYFVTSGLELDSGEEKTFSFELYNGPKEEKTLNNYQEYGLPYLINYGWFGFISGFFMSILEFLNGYIGNYGVAILLLTLIVKLCLHPITKRAQVSMHKMKDLQPKIQELQEKYEDDRQKLGEEQMKLFKEHGVNPLGGCLPMLCQFPVLIGLYYGIRVSFKIRQESFMLWVNDLSQPDHFMEIGMGQVMGLDFQYLNLLIIFMMATWLVQSLTHPSPSGGDGGGQAAMQQRMMKFMPMIFGVICYNFPSGLVLYWMMSTLFSALEQLYIRKIVLPTS